MKPSRLCLALAALLLLPAAAAAQDALRTEIAPGGMLRVALIGVRVLGGVGEPVGRFVARASKAGRSFCATGAFFPISLSIWRRAVCTACN